MSLLFVSCKKDKQVISEWDSSKRMEVINPFSSVKVYQTPSLTDTTRYLMEELKDGISTFSIATVIGDNLTVRAMNDAFLFSSGRDKRNLTSSTNLARQSCQASRRSACYSSTTCSIAYTLSWWTMEVIFAVDCNIM